MLHITCAASIELLDLEALAFGYVERPAQSIRIAVDGIECPPRTCAFGVCEGCYVGRRRNSDHQEDQRAKREGERLHCITTTRRERRDGGRLDFVACEEAVLDYL